MGVKHIWILGKHTFLGYRDDHGTRLAAAISYYALFSLIPLIIFVVSVFGFVLRNNAVQKDVIDQILSFLPLSETSGRSSVETALNNVKNISGFAAVLSLLLTLWTSSAMFGALRGSLNQVFRTEEHRPFFQAKLLDFAQVGGIAILMLSSIALTALIRTAQSLSNEHLGPLAGGNPLWAVALLLGPALISFAAFVVLYRIVPARHPRWIAAIVGGGLAALLFELLKNTFAIYVANFNNFDVVYGSLAGVLLFLLYTFLACNIVMIGGEVTATMGRMLVGEYASEFAPSPPGPPLASRALHGLVGLFVHRSQPVRSAEPVRNAEPVRHAEPVHQREPVEHRK
jgi:membrane protein